MATRFIPVSICRVPSEIGKKYFVEVTDKQVIEDINRRLTLTGYEVQVLDPEQFVVDPRQERLQGTLEAFVKRGAAAQAAVDKVIAEHKPKSPRQIAKAKGRVARLINKTARGRIRK